MRADWRAAIAIVGLASSAHGDDNLALARQRFQHGVELFGAGQWSAALEEFRASNALYASPNSRLYVARCLARLGRLDEAVAEYERTIGEGEERAKSDPRYAEAAAAARKEVEPLRPKIARVRVQIPGAIPASARMEIAGRSMPKEAIGLLVPVMPGHVKVRITADGFRDANVSVDVAAGSTHTVQVALEPLPEAPPPPPLDRKETYDPTLRTAAFIGLGVTAAAGIGFGVLAYATDREHQHLVEACVEKACDDATFDAYHARGVRLQTWTNVALGFTAVAAATTITLFVIAPSSRAPVSVQLGPGSLQLGGVF